MQLAIVSIWDKVFKNGPREICGRQSLKNLKWYGLLKQTFWKLSSTNFTWPILEYFVPFIPKSLSFQLIKDLGIYAEGSWIRDDFLDEVRW